MRPERNQPRQRSKGLAGFALLSMALAVCSSAPMAAGSSSAATSTNPALVVPSTYPGPCPSGGETCRLRVPASLRRRPMRLPTVARGTCPASTGAIVAHPGMAGVAIGKGLVTAIIGQSGDLLHGIVDLARSNVAGWYGLKTDWAISPHYSGWIIVRGKQLDGNGPVAALGDATVGAIVIPPGPTSNTFVGWREQPSGTYVKGPGCFGFQVDGSSFSEHIVLNAVLSTGS